MVVLATCLFALSTAAAENGRAPAGQHRILETTGTISTAKLDTKSGEVVLGLWTPHVRFRVPDQSDSKEQELIALLERANGSGSSLRLWFDGGRGDISRQSGTLIFPVCAIAFEDIRFEPTKRCAEASIDASASGQAALTIAGAQLEAGEFRLAGATLARVGDLQDPAGRKLLLRVRANVSYAIATMEESASAAADKAVAAALADYRALVEVEPNDPEVRFELAAAYEMLGGYAEAKAAYEAILARWPDEDFRVAIRLGALSRRQGNYGKALAALDDLSARSGPQQGMKFHYHRGWTLNLLGRHDEALQSLNEGIAHQPDYAWAYLRRACAHGSLSNLKEARADLDQGIALLRAMPGATAGKEIRDELHRAAEARATVDRAIAAGTAGPVSVYCSSDDTYERPRSRSALLPKAT